MCRVSSTGHTAGRMTRRWFLTEFSSRPSSTRILQVVRHHATRFRRSDSSALSQLIEAAAASSLSDSFLNPTKCHSCSTRRASSLAIPIRGVKGPELGHVRNTLAVSHGKNCRDSPRSQPDPQLLQPSTRLASMPLTCCAHSTRKRSSSSRSDSMRSRHPGPPSISAVVFLLSTPILLLLSVARCIDDDAVVPLVREGLSRVGFSVAGCNDDPITVARDAL